MSTTTLPAIERSVTVRTTVERAFSVFTEAVRTWWPDGYNIGQAQIEDVLIEGREGGRWYEKGVDGSECDWGRVLAWDPPRRLVLSWHLNGAWAYDPDPTHASEIEVRFTAEGPETTRVDLEHRLLERHGDSATDLHAAVGADDGWSGILARFEKAV